MSLRCRILGSRLRGWTDQRDRADPVKTLSRWALSAWMRLGWLPCVELEITTTGERVGSIGYEARLGQDSGRVRLKYTTTRWDGERRESDY